MHVNDWERACYNMFYRREMDKMPQHFRQRVGDEAHTKIYRRNKNIVWHDTRQGNKKTGLTGVKSIAASGSTNPEVRRRICLHVSVYLGGQA